MTCRLIVALVVAIPACSSPAAPQPATSAPLENRAPSASDDERQPADDELPNNLRLEGQVVNDDDDPVEAARVVLRKPDSDQLLAETATEEDGTFAFDSLAAGVYTVVVTHDRARGEQRTTLTVESDPVIIRIRGETKSGP